MFHWHIGVLTNSIDSSMKALQGLGVDTSRWLFCIADFSGDQTAVGTSGKLRSAVGRIGGVVYEFLEPLDDRSLQAAELKKKGPGIHHTAYVCDGYDDLERTVSEYLAAGGKKIWEVWHGAEHAYYVQAADGSMIIELINCCPFMPEE